MAGRTRVNEVHQVARLSNKHGTSVLFALEPLGLGTPYVESLSGYIRRLAAAHVRKPAALIEDLILKPARCDRAKFEHFANRGYSVDGASGLTSVLVGYLEALTWVPTIRRMTLLERSEALDLVHTWREVRAWCPNCLADDEQPYERLVWGFRAFQVCPIHEVRTVDACPRRSCGAQRRPYRVSILVDRCDACGQSLAEPIKGPRVKVGAATRVIVDLIARFERGQPITRDQIINGLGRFVTEAGGYNSPSARPYGANFYRILKRGQRIGVGTLVRVVTTSGESLDEFLSHDAVTLTVGSTVRHRPGARRAARTARRTVELKGLLERTLASTAPAPTLKEFARAHRRSVPGMWVAAPELTRALKDRGTAERAARKALRVAKERAEIESAVRQLWSETGSFHWNQLMARMPRPGMLRNPKLHAYALEVAEQIQQEVA